MGGPPQCTYVPRLIESLVHVKIADVCAGNLFTIALSRDGDVYGWGVGECNGIGKDALTPMQVKHTRKKQIIIIFLYCFLLCYN